MTAPACGSCTTPVGDGAVLCTGCTRDLAELLLLAASIAPDLDDAVARLLKRGSGGKSSSTEAPLPVDLAASHAANELRNTLSKIAYMVRTIDEYPGCDIPSLARWLAARLDRIRQHHQAKDIHREIKRTMHRALAVIDRQPDRAPAGQCDNCGRQLLAELGADTVICGCGMIILALQDKRRERAAAADVLGTPAEISGALKAIGIIVAASKIRTWGTRGRLTVHPGSFYAMSEVLALHAQASHGRK